VAGRPTGRHRSTADRFDRRSHQILDGFQEVVECRSIRDGPARCSQIGPHILHSGFQPVDPVTEDGQVSCGHDGLIGRDVVSVGPSARLVGPLAVGLAAEPARPASTGPLGYRLVAPIAAFRWGHISHDINAKPSVTTQPNLKGHTHGVTEPAVSSSTSTTMDHEPDDFSFESLYDDDDVHYRTCGKCGARTSPHWSEAACLEEARRYGWRRVAASDRPGARRMDLCGACADNSGMERPQARFGW